MRTRTSRSEWARRVAQWKRSGLSARAFAARHGINRNTFSHWVWRLGSSSASSAEAVASVPPPRFIELVATHAAAAPAPESVSTPNLELLLRDGLRLRVEVPAVAEDARRLAALVAALEAR